VTDFLRHVDTTAELCDELIAAGFTLFVSTPSDRLTPLRDALAARVGMFVAPADASAIAIATGVSIAGGYPAVLLSDGDLGGAADASDAEGVGDPMAAVDALGASRHTPLLLVIVLSPDVDQPGECVGTRRFAELLMAELCVETVAIEPAAQLSARVRVAREIVRERQRPAALLVPAELCEQPGRRLPHVPV
jgi:sulfopyruvate decarboxylase TPP-binding subunit